MIEKYNDMETEFENNKNLINVGYKEPAIYVLFALRQFLSNGNKDIILQSRGNNIPKAIIISEMIKKNYLKNLVSRTEIYSELIENTYVPVMKIHLSKYACVM